MTNTPKTPAAMHSNQCRLPTRFGEFTLTGYAGDHCALTLGQWTDDTPVLVRVHSECLTGDALFSRRCDCGTQLAAAMQQIQAAGSGAVLYLRQEGRGIGLFNKIKAYHLQDNGMDTVEANLALGLPADARDFSPVRAILQDLAIRRVRLMTNNPKKIEALRAQGIEICERVPLQAGVQEDNRNYLKIKVQKMGHLLENL